MQAIALAALTVLLAVSFTSCTSCERGGGKSDSAPTDTPRIYIELDKSEASVGETFVASVMVEDVENIYGAAFDLVFDSDAIELTGKRKGDFLGGERVELIAEFQSDDPDRLVVGISRTGDAEGRDGSGTLASFTLKALSKGNYVLALQNCALMTPELSYADVEVDKPTKVTIK